MDPKAPSYGQAQRRQAAKEAGQDYALLSSAEQEASPYMTLSLLLITLSALQTTLESHERSPGERARGLHTFTITRGHQARECFQGGTAQGGQVEKELPHAEETRQCIFHVPLADPGESKTHHGHIWR